MRFRIALIGAMALLMVTFPRQAISQPLGRLPQLPQGMPSRLVSDVPRLLQVYGAIVASFRDSIDVVDTVGKATRRDTILKRAQCGSVASSISGEGDTVYSFSTLGILAVDVPKSPQAEPAPFIGRDISSGAVVELERFLGFWQGAGSSTWTPSDTSSDRIGDISVYPNPFIHQMHLRIANGSGRIAAVRVYTLDGAYVTSLSNQGAQLPSPEWMWSGRDDDGRGMPPGCYMIQVLSTANGHSKWIMKTTSVIKL